DGQGQDTLVDILKVNSNGNSFLGFVLFRVLGFVVLLGLISFRGVGRLFLVALGGQWRWLVLIKHDDINAPRYRSIETGHVQPAAGWAGIGAGREIKILAIRVECRKASIAHSVGDLMSLAGSEVIEEDRAKMVLEL